MVGDVCRFYGWTDDHVLRMPAKRFFLMREVARKIMSRELVHQCYIARSSQLVQKSFEEVVAYFNAIGGPSEQQKRPLPPENKPSIPIGSQEAMHSVMSLFAIDRRMHRNPRPRNPG